MLLGTINTKSGTFLLTDASHSDGRYKIAVTGPATADYISRNAPSQPLTDEAYDSLYRAASEFCYSWSADHINDTRNGLEVDRNKIFAQLTNTVYDLRDDVRAVKHRAVNVDEGIYTQKACWETGCVENKSLRVAMMKRTWINADGTLSPYYQKDGYTRMEDDYIDNKTPDYRTHTHVEDVVDDLPQVSPRTPGSVDSSGNPV